MLIHLRVRIVKKIKLLNLAPQIFLIVCPSVYLELRNNFLLETDFGCIKFLDSSTREKCRISEFSEGG